MLTPTGGEERYQKYQPFLLPHAPLGHLTLREILVQLSLRALGFSVP